MVGAGLASLFVVVLLPDILCFFGGSNDARIRVGRTTLVVHNHDGDDRFAVVGAGGSRWEGRYGRARDAAGTALGIAVCVMVAMGFWQAVRASLAEERKAKGLCPHCGYDWGHSGERCPECGEMKKGTGRTVNS